MRILVTSDGSALAERGVAAIAPLAKEWGAEVQVLQVLHPERVHETVSSTEHEPEAIGSFSERARSRGAPVMPPSRVVVYRGQALEAAREEATELLGAMARKHLEGVAWSAHVEYSDDPAKAIIAFAAANGAGLIAVSSHGRSGLSQALVGSTTAALIRHAPVPVVVVGTGVTVPS